MGVLYRLLHMLVLLDSAAHILVDILAAQISDIETVDSFLVELLHLAEDSRLPLMLVARTILILLLAIHVLAAEMAGHWNVLLFELKGPATETAEESSAG